MFGGSAHWGKYVFVGVEGDVRANCMLGPYLEELLSISEIPSVVIVTLILWIGRSVLLFSFVLDC